MINTKFEERQRFTQWWIWCPLIVITLMPLYGLYRQMVMGDAFGDHPLSNMGLASIALAMLVLLALLWKIELHTLMDAEGIIVSFWPFTKKEVKWQEVEKVDVVDYGFVGGWGIRIGTKYGTVYNTRGKIGLALTLKSGKKLCIGTQREGDLKKWLKEVMILQDS